MSANSNQFGKLFQWTSFGESHGPAMGVVIDGCPSGIDYNEKLLLENLSKRKPGQKGATARQEMDLPKILSGVFENKTLGTPIAVVVENNNQISKDYSDIKDNPRVGHADDLWKSKFGHSDYRGGGRASARETLNWVIAGSFAQMFLEQQQSNVKASAQLVEVGGESFDGVEDPMLLEKLEQAKIDGESFGAFIEVTVQNPPKFVGEPIFRKLKAELTHAYMTINASCSVEVGAGVELAKSLGSKVHTDRQSDVYGGQRGGIATGESLTFKIGFKPTSSIHDVAKQGRHDPCVARRATPIVEAMTYCVLADLSLAQRLNQL